MKIVDIEQGTDEWHEFRKLGIGASDAAAILGMSQYKTPCDVYRDKKGLSFPTPDNAAMEAGRTAEPCIRNEWNAVMGKVYKPVCAIHDDYDFIRCSFDGYCEEDGSIIEIKFSRSSKLTNAILSNDLEIFKKEYPHIFVQVQHQMFVSDSLACDIVTISPQGALIGIEIKRDEDFIQQKLLPEVIVFWNDNVLRGTEPEEQEPDMPRLEDEDVVIYSNELEVVRETIARLQENEKELKAKIIDRGDDGDFVVGNLQFKRTAGGTRYDYKQACLDAGLDLDKYKKQSIGYYKVTKI